METVFLKKPVNTKNSYNKQKNYQNSGDVGRVINYIMNKDKRSELDISGGIYLIENEPSLIASEMGKVKELYKKQNSYQIKHFCLYVGNEIFQKITKKKFIKIFEKTLGYFKGIQIAYALHENTDTYHVHFALNTVSIYGSRLDLSDGMINGFIDKINSNFKKYYDENESVLLILYY